MILNYQLIENFLNMQDLEKDYGIKPVEIILAAEEFAKEILRNLISKIIQEEFDPEFHFYLYLLEKTEKIVINKLPKLQ